jgi:hypothetical protein
MARELLSKMIPVWLEEIQEVVESLDGEAHTCECCKLRVQYNFREHQIAENLRSFSTKLRRWQDEDARFKQQVPEPQADEEAS